MLRIIAAAFTAIALLILLPAVPAQAQATRTWVSGVGDDANPCSRTAPCRTFAGTISKTAAGGEISVLDPGNFGRITITKSMSIIAEGPHAAIIPGAFDSIVVNAPADAVVHLRGLTIDGQKVGLAGIKVVSAAEVFVEDCVIRGTAAGTNAAIDILPSVPTRIFVTNTILVSNRRGVRAVPGVGGSTDVMLDRVQIVDGVLGIRAGANANIRVNNSVITGQTEGITAAGGGKVYSFGNNVVVGNAAEQNFNGGLIPLR